MRYKVDKNKNVVVSFKDMTKKFGNNFANKNINFDVYENEVHALLGENGAGKSTLMSILFGLYKPTSGHIEINGEKVKIKDPRHANELKIAMLPQHFKLVDNMTVMQNVILGYEKINKNKETPKLDEKLSKTNKKLDNQINKNKKMIKNYDDNDLGKESIARKEFISGLNLKINKIKTSIKEIKAEIKKSRSTFYILSTLKKQFGLNIDLKAKVSSLTLSDKQKVEVLKILWRDAEIIIFDEPTSILTQAEIKSFLLMVKYMKSIGKTIFIITHKLHEIKEIADRVTIIRKGEYICTEIVSKVSELKLAKLMVGKEVNLNLSNIKRNKIPKDAKTALTVSNLSYKSSGYDCNLENINLEIKRGEILGIAAIDGNGQSELIKSIAGMVKSEGEITIGSTDISEQNIKNRYFNFDALKQMSVVEKKSYADAEKMFKTEIKLSKEIIKNEHMLKNEFRIYKEMPVKHNAINSEKIISKQKKRIEKMRVQIEHTKILSHKPKTLLSHIPEDRHLHGMFLDYSVAKNAVIQDIDFFTKFGLINYKDVNNRLNFFVDKYDIRGITSNKIPARKLSGGNQQKLILAREIERSPKLLLAAHPTRGLDVGAIRNVYESIIDAKNKGMAVLLNSGELEEIMQVSDRIIVMCDGKIVSESKRGELSKIQLGALMAGGGKND